VLGWTIRQVPYPRDHGAPPAATGHLTLVRRAWMRLRWRWAAMVVRSLKVALGDEIVRFAQNSIAQLCRATLAASRQLDDANGDRLLRVCVAIEL
jgi:hypothetical protein